jgi:hypothetical protein
MRERDSLPFEQIAALIGSRSGILDVPCPSCGPDRAAPANRTRRVLRIWHERPGFASYHCSRCGLRGYAHDREARPLKRDELDRRLRAARARHTERIRQRRKLAQWLWTGSLPARGTLAERYLRHRGITMELPRTLRFCPARGKHPPALVSAFGIPAEPWPGVLDVDRMSVNALHVTRLRPDGRGKVDDDGPAKVMIGPSLELPVVIAPVNDLGGLAIAEGVEDALSIAQATGLGAWAAGCANRLPKLARAVPHYVTSVTICVDDDDAGRRYSRELAERLAAIRGRRFEIIMLEPDRRAAA